MLLTDSFSIVAFQPVVSRFTVALPGLVAGTVLTVPVWHTLSTVGASPAITTDTGVGHHTEPLKVINVGGVNWTSLVQSHVTFK